jgi:hypothetical protein
MQAVAAAPKAFGAAAFWREDFGTGCFDLFILKQDLKWTRTVYLRAV